MPWKFFEDILKKLGLLSPDADIHFEFRHSPNVHKNDDERKTVYNAVRYVNAETRENDYSVRPVCGGLTSELPFQISGADENWNVGGGKVNNQSVAPASFTGRDLSLYIEVETKTIVSSQANANYHYIPVGVVVDGTAESFLTSNIKTNSDGCNTFYYWGI